MDDNHTSLSFLTKGSEVEVTSDEDGFTGAWFVATVIHPPPSISSPNNLVYVEYHDLLTDASSSTRLREYANVAYVRPSPDNSDSSSSVSFQLNDVVDAFCRDGWWTGVISSVLEDDNFGVTFQNPRDQIRVHISDLRVHRKWVDGKWVQPQNQRTAGLMFTVGKKVEVSFEKETLRDVWFPATILKNLGNNSFLVEYQQPGNGEEVVLHKETVDYLHIRPSPPHLRDKNFVLLEKVDAYYDFGWWSGVITKELADNRYNVFFKHTKKEREFIYSKVRPHMEWKGGKWFNTSQGDTDGRTLMDKQSKQTTPGIGRQSTVETSIMKRTKQQTNFDTDDKNSLPAEKSTDVIMLDDPSKKTNEPSVGQSQSEGFDSEVSGMNDQSFGKTENLSHGKKVRGKRGKSTEQKTPTTDSSRKRGKLSNELKSLQASDKGTQVYSVKTRSQETLEKNDVTKDITLPIVMGLQCNGMTVSQGKLLQKLPDEKTPNVAASDTKQQDVPLASLTVVDKEGSQGDAASVASKRKRGRPSKLQAKISEAPIAVEVGHENEGLDPSAVSLVEGIRMEEIDLPIVKEQPEHGGQDDVQSSKDELPVENSEQGLHVQQGTKKYSSRKGKRGKRRTISVNTTEAQAQDSQDASKEKGDGILEKDSMTKSLEPSVGKSLTTMPDDQPLSSWFDGIHTSMTVNHPDGTVEQSSSQLQIVACNMDVENLPFVRSTPLWKTVESMEVFQKIPQRPHFRPLLEGVNENAREGIAIGNMVTFTTVVEKTCGLRFDDPKSTIEDCLETLVELERYGFEVEVIRERLTGLLSLKDKQEVLDEYSKGVTEKVEEQKIRGNKIEEEIDEFNRQLGELEEKRKQAMLKKEKKISEIVVMKATAEKIKEEMKKVGKEFDELAAAPF